MILRDKNNFPINLGDIVVIHKDSELYGSLGIVFELTMIHNHHTIGIFIDNDELYLDRGAVEVIDNIEPDIFEGLSITDAVCTMKFLIRNALVESYGTSTCGDIEPLVEKLYAETQSPSFIAALSAANTILQQLWRKNEISH